MIHVEGSITAITDTGNGKETIVVGWGVGIRDVIGEWVTCFSKCPDPCSRLPVG